MFWDMVSYGDVIFSCFVHAFYGCHMMLTAIWMDLRSSSASGPEDRFRASPVIEADESETDNRERSNGVVVTTESDGHNLGYAGSFMAGHEKAPIVLVHGCFGFGEYVSLSIFICSLFCYHMHFTRSYDEVNVAILCPNVIFQTQNIRLAYYIIVGCLLNFGCLSRKWAKYHTGVVWKRTMNESLRPTLVLFAACMTGGYSHSLNVT